MQKNDRFYTFLLSHLTKTKNYIRRIEISKKFIHTGLAVTVIALVGIAALLKNTAFAKPETNVPAQTVIVNQPVNPAQADSRTEYKTISYDRPETDIDITYDSAGQASARQLTAAEIQAQQNSMESRIKMIIKTTNPMFLPTMWAHFGKINNEYGFRRNPFGGDSYEFHPGLDIDGEKGDVVLAPANGVVTKADWQGGYGNMVEISHGSGLITRYGHLSGFGVKAGDSVQRGQVLGLIGSTGRSTGPHLHFEVRLNDKPINPRRFLPPEIASMNTRK